MTAENSDSSQPQSAKPSDSAADAARPKGGCLTIVLGLVGLAVAAVVVFLIVVAVQPSEFQVQRSATIAAPPDEVFPHVNDLHKWQEWSPWAKLDPNAKATFEGPDAGEGAIFHWSGNDEIGEGSMTITESDPDKHVQIRLEFVRPMEDTATVEMSLQPQAEDATEVTWSMHGENNFVEKAFCLLMNLDEIVGGDFEKGLANLKEVVEQGQEQ